MSTGRQSVVGIVPAAGSGERLGLGRPKALAECGGRPLLQWSVDVLAAVCHRVVVALPPDVDGGDWDVEQVEGGASRAESVRNALAAAPDADVVVVHDAARPLVTVDLVGRCLTAIHAPGVDGAIAAARVTDTVKQADPSGRVLGTLDRETLWAVQTPQVFWADRLREALDVPAEVLARATDDAMLVEQAGGTVAVLEARQENLKVTTPLDLRIAEALLAERAGV